LKEKTRNANNQTMAETIQNKITLSNFFEQIVEVNKVSQQALKRANQGVSISEKNRLDLEKLIQTLEIDIGDKFETVNKEDNSEDTELRDSFNILKTNFDKLFASFTLLEQNVNGLTNSYASDQQRKKKLNDQTQRQLAATEDKLQKDPRTFFGTRGATVAGGASTDQKGALDKVQRSLKQFFAGVGLSAAGLALSSLISNDGGGGAAPESGDLRDIISRGEGGLNSVNRGRADDTPGGAISVLGRNLTDMTVDEVYAAQKSKKISAAGKNQITPVTMPGFRDYLKRQGVDTSKTKYDEKTQNMFFDYAITEKRPQVGQYLRGGNVSLDEATLALAAEYAAVGVPYDMKKGSYNGKLPVRDIKKGETLYADGPGDNRASIPPERIKESLRKQREKNTTKSAAAPTSTPEQQMSSIDSGDKSLITPSESKTTTSLQLPTKPSSIVLPPIVAKQPQGATTPRSPARNTDVIPIRDSSSTVAAVSALENRLTNQLQVSGLAR